MNSGETTTSGGLLPFGCDFDIAATKVGDKVDPTSDAAMYVALDDRSADIAYFIKRPRIAATAALRKLKSPAMP